MNTWTCQGRIDINLYGDRNFYTKKILIITFYILFGAHYNFIINYNSNENTLLSYISYLSTLLRYGKERSHGKYQILLYDQEVLVTDTVFVVINWIQS